MGDNMDNRFKICELYIDKKVINDSVLLSLGVSKEEIDTLLEDKVIVKQGSGYVPSSNLMYKYAKKLLQENYPNLAYVAMQEASKLDSNNMDAILYMIWDSVNNGYQNILEYIDNILNSKNKSRGLFYLYLVSNIMEIPPYYKEWLKYLSIDDLTILNNGVMSEKEKKIILSCYNKRFGLAKKQMKELEKESGLDLNNKIVKEMLFDITRKNEEKKKDIYTLVKAGNYQEVESILAKDAMLSHEEKMILSLVRDTLRETYPDYSRVSRTMDEAIINKNYEKALKLFNDKYGQVNYELELNLQTIKILLEYLAERTKEKEVRKIIEQEKTLSYEDAKALYLRKIANIKNDLVVVTKPLNKSSRQMMYKVAREFPDTLCSSAGVGKDKIVFITDYDRNADKEIRKELVQKLIIAGKTKDFTTELELALRLIRSGYIFAHVFASLGYAYLGLFLDRKRAIEFFTIANELDKEEGSTYDFTNLIFRLQNKDNSSYEKKPVTTEFQTENDFQDNISDNLFSMELELLNSGLSLDEITRKLNLTEDQSLIMYLNLARECFSSGYDTVGEKLLKLVIKNKNKTLKVSKLLKEIQSRKKFYKIQEPKTLTLNLKNMFKKSTL